MVVGRGRGSEVVREAVRVEVGGSATVAVARTSPEATGWAHRQVASGVVGKAAAEAVAIAQELVVERVAMG
jgi:hypothetical protein